MKPSISILCVVFVVNALAAQAQSKGEMPLSGSSPEVSKMVRDAWTMMMDAKLSEGRELLKQARSKDPDFALAYLDFGNSEKEIISKALQLRASADEKIFISGRGASLNNTLTADHFDPLLKKYPNDKILHTNIAYTINAIDNKKAASILNNLIKADPQFAPPYNLLGYIYMNSGDMEKAELSFNQYMSIKPNLANVYDSKADYLMKVGKTEEAIPLYEKAASMDPKNMGSSTTKAENAKNKLWGFKVPERTSAQKHNRVVFLAYASITPAIGFAKQKGSSVSDYATYCGNQFKTSWNKSAGFEGFVRGVLMNYESMRREADPAIAILSQDNNRIEFKWKINYKDLFNSDQGGATYDDLNQFFGVAYPIIAEYVGAVYQHEVSKDDWLNVTITRK